MTCTCQCPRCDSTGRYDRGTCFTCKGTGYVNRTNARGLTAFPLKVTYSNGSTNHVKIYATQRKNAVSIVERMLKLNKWDGVVE